MAPNEAYEKHGKGQFEANAKILGKFFSHRANNPAITAT
jgi:hypothetical protein